MQKETKECPQTSANTVTPFMNQENVQPFGNNCDRMQQSKWFWMDVQKHEQKIDRRCCQKYREVHDMHQYAKGTEVSTKEATL